MNPKLWPYGLIKESRPADWGVSMTVCIVSECHQQNCFVGVADSMISMSDMSADRTAIKIFSINTVPRKSGRLDVTV